MVFRRDNKGGDAFQRQISALRQQLGGDEGEQPEAQEYAENEAYADDAAYANEAYDDTAYQEESTIPEDRYSSELDNSNDEKAGSVPPIDPSSTVVNHDTIWKGEVDSQGSMHVLGRFEGIIKAREDVYILKDASVEASISAARVVIGGSYNGTVTCNAHLEVLPSGRVKGEIRSPVLVVHDGAIMNGRIQMTSEASQQSPLPSLVHKRDAAGSA